MTQKALCAAVVVLIGLAGKAHAQTVADAGKTALTSTAEAPRSLDRTQAGGDADGPSAYDRIWRFAEWYDDPSNPIVQKILFSGRYQHEFSTISSDQGDLDEWNVRRMRLGPRITLFRDYTVHGELEINPQEADPLYVRITDLYVQWSADPRLTITVGKQGVPFTLDGATSSKDLLTIDRSNLSNNIWFPQEYIPGVSVSGKRAAWSYRAGLYSAGEATRELGEFSGALFTLGSVGYDMTRALGAREALVSANYVYQPADPDNTFTRQLEHVVSVNSRLEMRRWGIRTDISGARGYLGQGNLWGVVAMPFLNVTARLQAITRYTFVGSDAANGVRLATYESRVVSGRGSRYDELYLGASYYFYGHKLKIQSGAQFATLQEPGGTDVYSGISWTTGLRIGW